MSASVPAVMTALLLVMPKMWAGAVQESLDELLRCDAALIDAEVPEDLQAVLDAGAAVGDLGEVIPAEFLLVVEAEGAVVGGDDCRWSSIEGVPETAGSAFRAAAA